MAHTMNFNQLTKIFLTEYRKLNDQNVAVNFLLYPAYKESLLRQS